MASIERSCLLRALKCRSCKPSAYEDELVPLGPATSSVRVNNDAPLSVSDNRLLEKSDLQAVLSERYQTDKYELQRGHDCRSARVRRRTFVWCPAFTLRFNLPVRAETPAPEMHYSRKWLR